MRPGAGRPPKPEAERRQHPVMLKLTRDELAALEAAAAGEPIGVYARRVLLRSLARRRR